MTNADKIRNMTDYELAEFLCGITNCHACPAEENEDKCYGYMTWLQRLYEE